MALELTIDQARLIARLRRRWPEADVRAHQRPWGVIVEVRRDGRTVSLTALDGEGGIEPARSIPRAASRGPHARAEIAGRARTPARRRPVMDRR
jgi:hypothetical protein